jgi:uncharacterized protein YyaL (SSP411 family)
MANRLAAESSPYLLQHKDNPVDWYPWGEEAFERARAEDKPVLLSVGYAACHWCHVMEHESFEDPATAEVMNEHFVCIKVDREERPDVDSVYMDAVQAMTGSGGWPMTVFLTPQGSPFYGGTYFPPDDRHGLPSFKNLLLAISEAWRDRREQVESQGQRLTEHIAGSVALRASTDPISDSILNEAFAGLRGQFDPEYGGFGTAPKFPQPMTLDFLLRMARRGNKEAGDMARTTLDAMAAGGVHDQLGGGFHRYSVDRYWLVPHFEKMLYDNAQLLRTYARSYLETSSSRHREVAQSIADWMLREMRDPGGGFYSTIDADSEGGEGHFYLWSLDEVREVTSGDFDVAVAHFGFSEGGNFEGLNIPVYKGEANREVLDRIREEMLASRSTRSRPETDTKVLTAWNGLAVSALAEAGSALAQQGWIDAAREAMDFVLGTLREEGRLMRSYRRTENGREVVNHLGYSEDYAYVLEGCIALFEATGQARWLEEARWAADEVIRLFSDSNGGFFTTGADAERLVTRPKDLQDNALPASNSVLSLELQKLAHLTGENEYESHALGAIRLVRDAIVRVPLGFGHWLGAVDFYTAPAAEVVIVGNKDSVDMQEMLRLVRERFRPNKVLVATSPGSSLVDDLPLLKGRGEVNGAATAYVCRNGVCKLPVTTVDALRAQL